MNQEIENLIAARNRLNDYAGQFVRPASRRAQVFIRLPEKKNWGDLVFSFVLGMVVAMFGISLFL